MDDFFGADGHVEVDRGADVDAGETRLQHAQDFERMIVERDGLPDYVGAASVFLLPETVAEDRGRGTSPLVVGGSERAAERGPQAERFKKLPRDIIPLRVTHLAAGRQIEAADRHRRRCRRKRPGGRGAVPRSGW